MVERKEKHIMNFNNFTIKSQEVIQKAIQIAQSNGNQAIEPEHLLKAVITQGEGVVNFILQMLLKLSLVIFRLNCQT